MINPYIVELIVCDKGSLLKGVVGIHEIENVLQKKVTQIISSLQDILPEKILTRSVEIKSPLEPNRTTSHFLINCLLNGHDRLRNNWYWIPEERIRSLKRQGYSPTSTIWAFDPKNTNKPIWVNPDRTERERTKATLIMEKDAYVHLFPKDFIYGQKEEHLRVEALKAIIILDADRDFGLREDCRRKLTVDNCMSTLYGLVDHEYYLF